MAEIFSLRRPDSRIDVDAYGDNGEEFEFKSTSKGSVSTSRDLGYNHLTKWQKRIWIVGEFTNYAEGFEFDRFWYLSPFHMADWYREIRNRLDFDAAIRDEAIIAMRVGGARQEVIDRVFKLCSDGALLNDPNISKGYIRKHGVPLNPCPSHLRQLVQQYPVDFKAPWDEFLKFK